MTRRLGKHNTTNRFFQFAWAAAIFAGTSGYSSMTMAQTGPVSVDLSVLNDSGAQRPVGVPAYTGTGELLIPPVHRPISRLHVTPKSGPKLVQPSPAKAIAQNSAASAPAKPMKKVEPRTLAPAAKVEMTETAPPAPIPEPVKPEPAPSGPKTAETPAPPPAPAPAPAPTPVAPAKSSAPPPPPKVAEAPKPSEVPETLASTASGFEIKPGRAIQIEFDTTSTKIPGSSVAPLRALAEGVRDKSDLRLQLMAYAGSDDLSASKARRLSLSRALSVRSFLIENGVRSTRIDVRALGNKTAEKPANRVDVNIAKR